jgi:hypothetical protein
MQLLLLPIIGGSHNHVPQLVPLGLGEAKIVANKNKNKKSCSANEEVQSAP